MGRHEKKPPANVAVRLAALAAAGHRAIGIARALGTSKRVLARWLEEIPELAEAFEVGRETYRMELESNLRRAARKGNVIANIFLLKAVFGYKEGDQSDSANRVSITFTLPGAMTPEQFAAAI